MDILTCDNIVYSTQVMYNIPNTPEPTLFKLRAVAECGSVIVRINGEVFACTELDALRNVISDIGARTSFITIDGVRRDDSVSITYFTHASKKLGVIDEYTTSVDRRSGHSLPVCHAEIIFHDICTACALKKTEIHGIVIRDYARNKSLFAIPARAPCMLMPIVLEMEKQFKPECMVEDVIKFYSTIECDLLWTMEV